MNGVDGNVLEGVHNLDTGVGVKCKFYVCCRRKRKPCQSVSQITIRSSVVIALHWILRFRPLNQIRQHHHYTTQRRNTSTSVHLNQPPLFVLPFLSLSFLLVLPLKSAKSSERAERQNLKSGWTEIVIRRSPAEVSVYSFQIRSHEPLLTTVLP